MIVELKTIQDKKIQLYNNIGKINRTGDNLELYYIYDDYEQLRCRVQFRQLLLFRVIDDTTYFK